MLAPQGARGQRAHSLTLLAFGSEFGPGSSRNRPSCRPTAPYGSNIAKKTGNRGAVLRR